MNHSTSVTDTRFATPAYQHTAMRSSGAAQYQQSQQMSMTQKRIH
jgi:hypothetical protein